MESRTSVGAPAPEFAAALMTGFMQGREACFLGLPQLVVGTPKARPKLGDPVAQSEVSHLLCIGESSRG